MKSTARSNYQKIWRVKSQAPGLSFILARKLKISRIVAQLLINRRIYTVDQARAFFANDLERLFDPMLLSDMDKAVERIVKAVDTGEKILVYGDYDADGITATVLLVKVLRNIGAIVDFYIPSRLEEGYGLHLEGLKKARKNGTTLIITVDCGINDLAEAVWAKENGLDLIVTDHHEPPPELPEAYAVINPKRQDCIYPFKNLSGVGTALKLAKALLSAVNTGEPAWHQYLDLVCIGTIADIVPLLGENRILVKHGLARLANTSNPGLLALMAVCGINRDKIGVREVGFGMAPRLNAAGRVGSPQMAVNLLLTENPGEAWELASELTRENQVRQKIETKVLEEALKLLEINPELKEKPVIVLASENWHPGVIGIAASKILDYCHRPVLLIAFEGDKGKGSARSIPEFNMYQALAHCQKYLVEYGGHALAAGFSIRVSDLEAFRAELLEYANQLLDKEKLALKLELDCLVEVKEVSERLVSEISLLEPFGQDNPDPLLGCLETSITESRCVGKDYSHLKLRLKGVNTTIDGIGFNMGLYVEEVSAAKTVDLAFIPGINEFNGRRSVQLDVKDLGIPAVLDLSGESKEAPVFENAFEDNMNGYGSFDIREELFIPEFVNEIIKNTNDLREQEFYCGGNMEMKIPPDVKIDLNNGLGRPGQVKKIAEEGENLLVITTCGYQALEIGYFLQMESESLKRKIFVCSRAVNNVKSSTVLQAMDRGKVRVVVSTPETLDFFKNGVSRVLLYNLPFSPKTVYDALAVLKHGGKLYLLHTAEDLKDNIDCLNAMAPDRNYLAGLYKKLFTMSQLQSGRPLILDVNRTAKEMAEKGFGYQAYSVEIALIIMRELGLLTISRDGKDLTIELCPRPTKKKKLVESQTYRYLHQVKEESINWMRKFLIENTNNIYTT